MAPVSPAVLHLSLVVGGGLRDAAGERLGRVDDLIVRLGDENYPPVTGVVATIAGRPVFVAAERSSSSGLASSRFGQQLDLQHFQRRPQEVLLKKDVLDRQLINVDGARLVRTNEIELARLDGWYRVVGVDVSLRGCLRRRHPRGRFARRDRRGQLPRLGLVSSRSPGTSRRCGCACRIRSSRRSTPRSSPTLSKRRSHNEGEEIMAAVAVDPEREAELRDRSAAGPTTRIPSWQSTSSRPSASQQLTLSASIVGYLKMLVTLGTLRHQLAVDYDLPANVRHFVRRLARQQGVAWLDPRRTLDRLYAGTGRLTRALEFVEFLEAQEPVIIEAQSSLFGFRRRIRNARRRLVTPRDGGPRWSAGSSISSWSSRTTPDG